MNHSNRGWGERENVILLLGTEVEVPCTVLGSESLSQAHQIRYSGTTA